MKIFIISHDLSTNAVGRAAILAQLYGRRHTVEIVGPCFGSDIWFPCRKLGLRFRRVDGEIFLPQATRLMACLLDKLKGDLVVAVKPRPASYGIALMHRALSRKPVILDIDDDEMAFYKGLGWRTWDRKVLLRRPNSPLYTALLKSQIREADGITVASRPLHDRYGGVYLPHVKDPSFLDPAAYDKKEERRKRGLPLDEKLIMFAGSPRGHKGLKTAFSALSQLPRKDVRFVIVGFSNDPDNKLENDLRKEGGERLYALKQVPISELPAVLSTADMVVLPQSDTLFAQFQTPSKIFDAMSMSLPIVASAVSDIPEILEGGCGVVVPPDDPQALSEAIGEILDSRDLAVQLGTSARKKLIERYSFDAVEETVEDLLQRVAAKRKGRSSSDDSISTG